MTSRAPFLRRLAVSCGVSCKEQPTSLSSSLSPYGEIRTRSASEGKERCYEERTKVRSRKTHALVPMDQPTEKKIPHLHPFPLERERRNRAVADVKYARL